VRKPLTVCPSKADLQASLSQCPAALWLRQRRCMLVAAVSDHVRGVFGMQALSRTGIAHGLIGSIRFSAWKPAAACGTWSSYLTPLILFLVASQHSRLQSKNRQQAITRTATTLKDKQQAIQCMHRVCCVCIDSGASRSQKEPRKGKRSVGPTVNRTRVGREFPAGPDEKARWSHKRQ
jgi:hypothetical protein